MEYRFPEIKTKPKPNINGYKKALKINDNKILTYFNETYLLTQYYMGNDGGLSVEICKLPIQNSKVIIKWATSNIHPVEELRLLIAKVKKRAKAKNQKIKWGKLPQ